jgi:hypothetical protein
MTAEQLRKQAAAGVPLSPAAMELLARVLERYERPTACVCGIALLEQWLERRRKRDQARVVEQCRIALTRTID